MAIVTQSDGKHSHDIGCLPSAQGAHAGDLYDYSEVTASWLGIAPL